MPGQLLTYFPYHTVRRFQRTLHPSIPGACMFAGKMNPALPASIQPDITDLPHIVLSISAALPWVVAPAFRNASFELFRQLGKNLAGVREYFVHSFRGAHRVEPQRALRLRIRNE